MTDIKFRDTRMSGIYIVKKVAMNCIYRKKYNFHFNISECEQLCNLKYLHIKILRLIDKFLKYFLVHFTSIFTMTSSAVSYFAYLRFTAKY